MVNEQLSTFEEFVLTKIINNVDSRGFLDFKHLLKSSELRSLSKRTFSKILTKFEKRNYIVFFKTTSGNRSSKLLLNPDIFNFCSSTDLEHYRYKYFLTKNNSEKISQYKINNLVNEINVYVLFDEVTCLYKIGKAKNLKKRLTTLQCGNATKLQEIALYTSNSGSKLERLLHEYFSAKRVRGEWFNLDNNDLNLLLSLTDLKKISQLDLPIEFCKKIISLNIK